MLKGQNDGSVQDEIVLTGSNVPNSQPIPTKQLGGTVTMNTVVNASSVLAAGSVSFNITPTTEKEIWIAVTIDQQPWSMYSSSLFYSGSDGADSTYYPKRVNVASTHTIALPCVSLYLGLNLATSSGLTAPTSMLEARQYRIPYLPAAVGQIVNNSAVTATITVKIIRMWG